MSHGAESGKRRDNPTHTHTYTHTERRAEAELLPHTHTQRPHSRWSGSHGAETLSQCEHSPIILIYTAEATEKSDRCQIIYLCLRPSTWHGERFLYSSDRNAHSGNWTAWSGNWTAWRMLDNVGCPNGTRAERSGDVVRLSLKSQCSPNVSPYFSQSFAIDFSVISAERRIRNAKNSS